jgi:hypothetical protein
MAVIWATMPKAIIKISSKGRSMEKIWRIPPTSKIIPTRLIADKYVGYRYFDLLDSVKFPLSVTLSLKYKKGGKPPFFAVN